MVHAGLIVRLLLLCGDAQLSPREAGQAEETRSSERVCQSSGQHTAGHARGHSGNVPGMSEWTSAGMNDSRHLPSSHCPLSWKGSAYDKAHLADWLSARNWPRDQPDDGGEEASRCFPASGATWHQNAKQTTGPAPRAGYQNISILVLSLQPHLKRKSSTVD